METLTTASNWNHSSEFNRTEKHMIVIILRTTFIGLTTFLILAGNIINFIVLNSTPLWHRSTRALLKNLSMTDFCIGLCFTVFAIYPSAADLSKWPYGDGMLLCNITSFVGGTCCAASIITLALISIDRYFIVQRPLDHQNYMSVTNVRLLIIFTWMVAAGLHLLPLIELEISNGDNSKGFSFYNQAAFLCSARYSDFEKHTLMLFFLIYALTNLVILWAYFRIIPVSLKHSKFIRRRGNQNSATKRDRLHLIADKSNKSVCTLLFITLVFNACWAPTAISVVVELFKNIEVGSQLEFIFAWAAMSNSFLNTFVYMAMNAKYRRAVKKLFICTARETYIPHRKLSSTYLSSCTKQTEL